jgi:hypothetical protein
MIYLYHTYTQGLFLAQNERKLRGRRKWKEGKRNGDLGKKLVLEA